MEDTETEPDVGVGHVAVDVSERISHGTDVHGCRGSIGVFLDLIPHAIEISSGCPIAVDIVGWVGDPEGSSGSVGLKHTSGGDRGNGQVVSDSVVGFNSVLNEEVVTLDVVSDVLFDGEVVDTVNCGDSGE